MGVVRRKLSNFPWYGLLWIGALGSIVGMAICIPSCWDLAVYQQAMKSLREGLDPYAIGQAHQIAEHARGHIACTYVYPPLTTVILRILNYVPAMPGRLLYWTLYAAGFGAQLWAVSHLAQPRERKLMRCLLPLAVFFPGLIPNEVILSGNVAIPLYGAVWAGAILGWKTERWGWFYAAVLAASLFKLPLLTLLAIPMLMGAAQFMNSVMTAAGGLGLFFAQRLIWPKEFAEYLSDVQMQFTLNHDFGRGPAGMFGHALYSMGRSFTAASTFFYLAYGALTFVVLASFARMYRREEVKGTTWMTLLLTGTILLNPRIMSYDALALTVPMMLLVVRGWQDSVGRWCLLAGVASTTFAYVAGQDNAGDAILMVSVFVAGVYGLLKESRSAAVVPFPNAAATPVALYGTQTSD
jgi:hypothetical protein